MLHLSRREADIVISLERPAADSVIVNFLITACIVRPVAISAAKPLVATRENLRHHAFVSYVDDLLFTKELQFLDALHQPERFAFRSTSITAQYEAVRVGRTWRCCPRFWPTVTRCSPRSAARRAVHPHVLDEHAV